MDLGLFVQNLPIVLIAVGFVCLAPLFRGALKPVSRLLVVVGFFLGILALVLTYVVFSSGHYDTFSLVILGVAGLMLFLRPIRGLRWAALVAFGVGLLASYYAYNTFHVTTTVLVIVFVAATLLLYLLFKFAEDLLGTIAGILSFPPIAVIIGIMCILQAILILMGTSLTAYLPPLHIWPFS
ncbi:MAG TPA: hypothetical protein VED24_03910 [Candidatus Acidoferrum sp.]|nr:hypothetical protein [Candidatus Acidoferrum sp.]